MTPIPMDKRHEERQRKVTRPLTDYEKWRLDYEPDYILSDNPVYDFQDDTFAEIRDSVDSEALNPLEPSGGHHQSVETEAAFDHDKPSQLVGNNEKAGKGEFKYTATISPQLHDITGFAGYLGIRPLLAVLFILLALAAKSRTTKARSRKEDRA
ncbi:hypothetical protein BGW36DRAFT_409340 [Talaromyces proteolyticus]|uniref:Uncharacterized protein n=1 Tax=Talaromyces proteolyticus TaxID=1131652 RepID=A0AAD4KPA6_9EURO|nr:uncharacterized protein BGW36DRAFT_409340 [Talaromyces proteolyticus]KAH8693693.1 hypothetical protein BGW36DRAFT_409340 [Talaromyces proteolyticus]